MREHIFQLIAAVVKSADVSYIKWDMNRHLTEAFSVALPPSRQGEVLFRYTMGVYALHERFTSAARRWMSRSSARASQAKRAQAKTRWRGSRQWRAMAGRGGR